MTLSIERSIESKRDVEEIFVYIGIDNIEIATKFLVAVEDCYRLISEQPRIGSPLRFENTRLDGVRVWQIPKFENYLIVYLVRDETIKILHVLNSRRNFDLIFDS